MFDKPLVVDLDGTLIHVDTLHESALNVIKINLFEIFLIPLSLLKGKACFKQYLASKSDFNPQTLPYNEELLEWLMQRRTAGQKLILCTAADRKIANLVAGHLGIFEDVIASDGILNVSGEIKAAALVQRFGHSGYDYVGNSYKDLPVWAQAHKAIVVNGSISLVRKVQGLLTIERVFAKQRISFFSWLQVLRIHQWLKNLLLFVPLLAAHDLGNIDNGQIWGLLTLAFLSFSFCASSAYISNDLLDLGSDRKHSKKKYRPFASGLVPAWLGVLAAPLLLLASLSLATLIGMEFLLWLILYYALTCAYSLILRQLILIDCLSLAFLYSLRVIAGAAVVEHNLSFWLLAFSFFLFLSLAFIKRYSELEDQLLDAKVKIHGRGYYNQDASIIQIMGVVAGYSSVLLFALYLNSDTVLSFYRAPELIWGAVPILLFWVNWIWMQAHRGKMHEDPLVFAVKDPVSLLSGVFFVTFIIAGTIGISW